MILKNLHFFDPFVWCWKWSCVYVVIRGYDLKEIQFISCLIASGMKTLGNCYLLLPWVTWEGNSPPHYVLTTLLLSWGCDVHLCLTRLLECLQSLPQFIAVGLKEWILTDAEIQILVYDPAALATFWFLQKHGFQGTNVCFKLTLLLFLFLGSFFEKKLLENFQWLDLARNCESSNGWFTFMGTLLNLKELIFFFFLSTKELLPDPQLARKCDHL
ncbi:LOW QUALITY PROTEIN: NLR family CARD domain-containing protein 4 [Gracilinanus agilis]|uniref:LOW QUALITY PROTEIN: NLR family CARD domain-containing protein 4 n=1 Tax=Gracilinanus agilis TaxID=191870 RepID=UPI001CFEDAC1|nr:LOW QUALITY PROTEIN: NLR family CARD domain-containing protein 4 [Gracilinanus agilis]